MGYKGAPGAIATVEGCTVKVTICNSINILKIIDYGKEISKQRICFNGREDEQPGGGAEQSHKPGERSL